jgi:hypothetical protein
MRLFATTAMRISRTTLVTLIAGCGSSIHQSALTLNPRHRSAHEHLGEAHLAQGDLAKAKEHLAALEQICLIPCDEYDDLKRAIAEYNKVANR